jgi:DNA topoisomerase-3
MRLFLCEKPSQGKDIARVLGAQERGNGCLRGDQLVVTWCIGHLVEAAPPEDYDPDLKRWSIAQLPIIPDRWKLSVKSSTAAQFKVVQQLLAGATEVVIATDADREGEMIARELLDLCGFSRSVRRLWLSALNDASIRQALNSLRDGDETRPLYLAALARSRADWLVGLNLSRLFTCLGRQAGYDGVLSVGRVQTPTLQLVVRRDREIDGFVSRPYWAIDVKLSASGSAFIAHWVPPKAGADEDGRCVRQELATAAAQSLRAARAATVISVDTQRVREAPPLPFDLSTLQVICSRRFGLDVKRTLDVAQSLYEVHKAITYPRSDCAYLPESMLTEVDQVLDGLLRADPSLSQLGRHLNRQQRSRAWNDAKITAHHGIIPTVEAPTLSKLSQDERAVYELIRAHYLAQFLPFYEFDRTVAQLSCGDQQVRARGQQVVSIGWHVILSYHTAEGTQDESANDQTLPPLTRGADATVESIDLKSLKTSPPKPYTQGELIAAMKGIARLVTDPRLKQKLKDTTGIGTEATRAGIIEGLIRRGYLLKKGRALRAANTAFTLIDAIPAAIADPGTTALWEQSLDQIAAGRMTLNEFVDRQSTWVRQIIEQYARATLVIDVPLGPPCSLCSAPTRQRRGAHGAFWSCSRYPECSGTQPLRPEDSSSPDGRRSSRRRSARAPSRR